MSFYCAYVHAKPRTRTARGIFYVGKGNENRPYNFNNTKNADYKRVAATFDQSKTLIGLLECSTEEIAFDLERGLIKRLRAMGVDIVNATGGGRGTLAPTPELRIKLEPNWIAFGSMAAERNVARVWTQEARDTIADKTSQFMTGMGWVNNGVKEKRFPLKEEPPQGWVLGRLPKSVETVARISASLIGNTHTRGNKWITNGFSNKQVKPGDLLPDGWWFGQTKFR